MNTALVRKQFRNDSPGVFLMGKAVSGGDYAQPPSGRSPLSSENPFPLL